MTGQCGDHGECINGHCSCLDGYNGQQCQVAPAGNITTNQPSSVTPSTKPVTPAVPLTPPPSTPTTTPASSATSTEPASTTLSPAPATTLPPAQRSREPADIPTQKPDNAKGSGSGSSKSANNGEAHRVDKSQPMPVAVLILAIFSLIVVVGMILFGVYARKMKLRAANAEMERTVLHSLQTLESQSSTTPRERIQVL
ncbi:hypothetical protein ACHHYP_07734 [Achlya hypogyna]|uniref:EGF-like domain-containing protein n=1 Tax=Achlya hypogyna TaxID=1202772 RepID=A0A1V9ZLK6_ACHHY|nr:hypothetical protein ACHHYP_07734 [Achlya hypogyna]